MTAGPVDREAAGPRRGDRLHLLVLGLLLLPLAVGAVRALLEDRAAPAGDVALIELRVRDVGSSTPLLGSYGRFGFNHPGPLLFYVLAVPYRLLGSRFAGMEVGVLALGALAVSAVVWVARRRGGTPLLLWAGLLVAVLVAGAGPAWVADPWEPHGLLLPCLALVLLAADAAGGRAWTLPLVAGTASLLGQAQATLLPFALAMGAVAVAGVVRGAWRRPGSRSGARRALVASAAVVVVLWVPTAVEQLTRDPGNVRAMARSLGGAEPSLGLADGFRLVAVQLGLRAPWLGWATPLDGLDPIVDPGAAPLVPAGAVALAVALVVATRRRLPEAALAGTAAVAAVVGGLALSRLLGPPFVWIPQWTRVLGLSAWLAAGGVAAAALPRRTRSRLRTPVTVVLVVAVAVLSVTNAVRAATEEREDDPVARVVEDLAEAAGPVLERLDGPVLVSSAAAPQLVFGTGSVGMESLALALERSGLATVVDAGEAHRFGPERARPERATAELRLALARSPVPDDFDVVATADPLSGAERAERRALLESIGLGDEATMADVVRAVARDPSVRPVWEQLQDHTDLPPFALLVREPAPG